MIDVNQFKLRYITDKKGNKTEVILTLKDFEEILEDLEDLAIAAERRDEEAIPHNEVVKELKRDGLL